MKCLQPYQSLVIQSGFTQKLFTYQVQLPGNSKEVETLVVSTENPTDVSPDEMQMVESGNMETELESPPSHTESKTDESVERVLVL